ncbi:hypothetical protein NMG60_11032146 [Bertholletia excelsa]
MAEGELDLRVPSCLQLTSAFLAMEPPHVLISIARSCDRGLISERVQSFIWDHCISKADEKSHAPYLKSFLKKLIGEVESQDVDVLDELYERFAFYMISLKDDDSAKTNSRVLKCISFLFPEDCFELPSCPKSRKLVVPLQSSLNMLEGDTGCSIWPSSLFLAEFILSCPKMFCGKSCFEVGSGVGLVGIGLAHAKASKVILSDGDLSSLANMKLNLELNNISTGGDLSERTTEDTNLVQCIHLPWESVVGSEVQSFMPDIVLGADVIYDPLCLPYLVQVLASLLNRESASCHIRSDGCKGCGSHTGQVKEVPNDSQTIEFASHTSNDGPVAFIASVIRNIDTFRCFLALATEAKLNVKDVTEKYMPFNLLPYMKSYDQSSIRLFSLTHL